MNKNNVKVDEKITNESDLFKFLNSIGVLRHLNRRKTLVLLDKAKNITLSVNKDGGSYTDHKKIVIGIPTNLLLGLSKKRVLLVLEGLTIHECFHNLRTVQELWIDFIDRFGEYMAKEFDAPLMFCKRVAKELLNCVEDGRIERIASRENTYNSKCLAITNATFFNNEDSVITERGSNEDELQVSISNFVSYAKFGVPIRGYAEFYGHNMKYMNKAKRHIFKFVEEDDFKEAIPHLENAINECYDLFKDLFSKIDFNDVEMSNQNEIGDGCGADNGKSSGSSSSSSDDSKDDSKDSSDGSGDSKDDSSEKSTGSGKGDKKDSSDGSDGEGEGKGEGKEKGTSEGKGEGEGEGEAKTGKDKGTGKGKAKGKDEGEGKSEKSGGNAEGDSDKNSNGKPNKKAKEKVDRGYESETQSLKERIEENMSDIIMNTAEIDDSLESGDISDILKEIESSIETELEESISSALRTIERQNEVEEVELKELRNEADDLDINNVLAECGKSNSDWKRFKLRYIYQDNVELMEAPKEYLKNAYRMREYFKKVLEPQKKSISKNKRVGQVDRGGLWKYAVNDTKMFQRNNNPKNNDYAIYIMVDGSGSMGGYKFNEAFLATTLLEDVLSKIVPLKIVMFSTNGDYINHNVVKNFSDNKNGNYSYTFLKRNGARGANADGLSIRFATKELAKRKERDKMLIILSDGQPSSSLGYYGQIALNDVKGAVKSARESGIKVFNIMFGSEYERQELKPMFKFMYEKGIVSCNPDDIAEELMRIVKTEIK